MEERPDVDQIYMRFVQLTTGQRRLADECFYHARQIAVFRRNLFSARQTLQYAELSADFGEHRRRVATISATSCCIRQTRSWAKCGASGWRSSRPADLNFDQLDAAFLSFTRTFDAMNGGFGGAPKFPPSMSLEFFFDIINRTKDENALEMVTKTCDENGARRNLRPARRRVSSLFGRCRLARAAF